MDHIGLRIITGRSWLAALGPLGNDQYNLVSFPM
jgi:hypothetical protein